MSDITVINDSEQSSLVTNGLAKNGELYLKAEGSTDAGAIVVYDAGNWRKFENEASSSFSNAYSANFDGSDILTCGSVSELNSASDAAISCWFNGSSFPSTYNTLWGGGPLSNAGRFWFNCTLSRFRLYNGSTYKQFSTSLSVGNWYHVVVVISGTTNLSLYLNGSQLGSTVTFPALQSTAGDSFKIGSVPVYPTLFLWNGEIDDVSIFNSALSAADITELYNSGAPTDLTLAGSYDTDRTSNLKGYWRMGDDSNDSPVDSGNISGITNTANPGTYDATTVANSQPTFADLTGETIYV